MSTAFPVTWVDFSGVFTHLRASASLPYCAMAASRRDCWYRTLRHPQGNNQGHTIARGVGRGVVHHRKQFGGEIAHGGIVGGEQLLAIRNVAICRGEQDP